MRYLKKILNDFLYYEEMGVNKSENTLKIYRVDILQFINYIIEYEDIHDFSNVNHYTIRSFMAYLDRNNRGKRTINRKISSLRMFFKYLKKKDLIDKNYMTLISNPKFGQNLPTVLNKNEVIKILREIKTSNILGIRDRCIVELLYSTGLRAAELLDIKEKLIDFSAREIRVIGKGEKERTSFFSNSSKNWILKYIEEKRKKGFLSEYLFLNSRGGKLTDRSLRRLIENYSKKAGIEKEVTPHTFRHTYATYLLNEGVDIRYVQELLGHSNITTTQIYTHVSKEILRDIYIKTHPMAK
ncbi:site-specific tyrosine recombinase/integron integrase [Haliovirga abyssi]|uniref:Tyrosine recombinase XerD n=1 Tax=Haliovirga abyssi TaxID=2996794 RepID=A0AAU9DRS3_9FUSO|nr:site-specific tyrosine recombinase/integron integrase [Haliovirga abyssi]BDU49659.1 tyrosine recombinase XerD [Haliovirga abyssi]